MPFLEKIETEIGALGIWKLSESVTELVAQFRFSDIEKKEFGKIKFDRRKTEYLATRLLLQLLLNKKPEINYLESGKPKLNNSSKNISISHSADFVVVLLSEKNIGIDVENIHRKIEKIATKFLHKDELKVIGKSNNKQVAAVLYWSAKEAIFKCTGQDGIQFNTQIIIEPFSIKNEGYFVGTLNKKIHYKLWYRFYENNVIVYCVE